MGKKDKTKKTKTDKAAKVVEPSTAELEAREVELKGKLKKAAKRAKAKSADIPEHDELATVAETNGADVDRAAFLLGIIADLENNSQRTREMAKAELASMGEASVGEAVVADVVGAPSDAELDDVDDVKARVKAKKLLRKIGELDALKPDDIDRGDAEAVAAYNLILGVATGHYLTSEAEGAARDAGLAHEVKPLRKAGKDELVVTIDGETLAAPQVAEEVTTETGREFAVGVEAPAKPSESTTVELEFNGLGQYKILSGETDPKTGLPKTKGMTRVTTFIDNLEDKTALDKWKLRTMLEGVTIDTLDSAQDGRDFLTRARDAIHNRDVDLGKIAKADRKGKLERGERGTKEAEVLKAYKALVNKIADDALEMGGVHEKANKGTDLHALCQLYDAEGFGVINEQLHDGKITPADHADIAAYAGAMLAAGIKVLESELVVVDDVANTAGRLDMVVLAKPSHDAQRAIRMVADIKTGNVEFGKGKIAQQLSKYTTSKGYDIATGERRDLKLSKTVGLLIWLPQGQAKCVITPVDLILGQRGNKLSTEVRAWRNEGKAAFDIKIDLATPSAVSVPGSAS